MASEVQSKIVQETFHFINSPADAINDALTGLTYLKPDLSYNAEYKVVYRSDLSSFSEDHVTTIGFAGGGHEPMFGGFVGNNYLSAYVSGNIFASPTAAQIFEAIRMCQPASGNSKGTLVVCGNYTGDVCCEIGKRRGRHISSLLLHDMLAGLLLAFAHDQVNIANRLAYRF